MKNALRFKVKNEFVSETTLKNIDKKLCDKNNQLTKDFIEVLENAYKLNVNDQFLMFHKYNKFWVDGLNVFTKTNCFYSFSQLANFASLASLCLTDKAVYFCVNDENQICFVVSNSTSLLKSKIKKEVEIFDTDLQRNVKITRFEEKIYSINDFENLKLLFSEIKSNIDTLKAKKEQRKANKNATATA